LGGLRLLANLVAYIIQAYDATIRLALWRDGSGKQER
jgi:hypothetical protein